MNFDSVCVHDIPATSGIGETDKSNCYKRVAQ
jgi:hypothetical protein